MNTSKSELDVVIAEVKEQFRLFLTKRRELVLKLGHAYEQVVGDFESICEEIKNVLHDEIVQKVISRRDIERYCPDTWKQKTKPKNDKLSFSADNDNKRKKVDHRKIKATTTGEGISVMEPLEPASLQIDAAPSAKLKQEAVEKLDVTNIIPEYNASQSGIGYDGLTRSELLSVIRQLQKEVTYLNERCNQYRVTISELEDALAKTSFIPAVEMPETVSQSSPSKNDEVSPTDHFNNVSQQPIQPRTLLSECPQCTKYAIQIQELMDDAKTKGVVASDELEFEFSMHFEDVRRYMVPIFEIYKGFGEVWFHGMLDIRTRKVTSVSTVRWIDSSQNDQDES